MSSSADFRVICGDATRAQLPRQVLAGLLLDFGLGKIPGIGSLLQLWLEVPTRCSWVVVLLLRYPPKAARARNSKRSLPVSLSLPWNVAKRMAFKSSDHLCMLQKMGQQLTSKAASSQPECTQNAADQSFPQAGQST